ncbi:substrate-binding domain-containing protein [Sphingomonas sp. H39-1-10]|uniref:substrate-binding domain-containing protein n=1 Tax=Sphingomonas TaxID=13687 RepID=UPI000886F3FF|nr:MULTISPECIES: substrate-binding domain-containing protein [Sphingomonas]MDF0488794.1 substrate-binding domain-containing protein [Sphingomonas pollutisoli]SDA13642.1 phosphate transport system substrate-binding protein [Sphingomonas sp. NFR15]
MHRIMTIVAASALATGLAGCTDQANGGGAGSRDQIKVVGSSTVFPFTTIVAERFVEKTPGVKSPVIESTGTGGGMKLFCGGVGADHPDIEDASRRMKRSEYDLCKANGVADIMEVQVGLDGIAFAEAKSGPGLRLTTTDLFKAMAAAPDGKPNAAKTWKDVNPALPAMPIQIYGPPATSGTRDALAELILARGCEAMLPDMAEVREKNPAEFAQKCTRIREDGAYVDAGENDNLIVQKLQSNPNAVGIFGYSYLEENRDKLNGIPINGTEPTYETISRNQYPGSRPLYLYVKKAHLSAIRGLREFLKLYAASWNPGGPLVAKGLIASPDDVRKKSETIVNWETTLDPKTLP